MSADRTCVEAIAALGLSDLEAEVYVFLLGDSPATGYRIAKGTQRSFTTIYKVLRSLEEKGATLVDEGKSRLSRAVPMDEFLDQIESRFHEKRRLAAEAAARLPKSKNDTRVYQLSSVEQVYERARHMLGEARERVLLEIFPEPLEALRDDLEATAARGVDVTARVYRPTELRDVRIVQSPFGEETVHAFRSEWLAIFVDGRQYLLGHLARGGTGVLQILWSESPILARSLYDYVNSDLHHYAFLPYLESAKTIEEARAAWTSLQEAFPAGGDLGFRDLQERLDEGRTTDAPDSGKE